MRALVILPLLMLAGCIGPGVVSNLPMLPMLRRHREAPAVEPDPAPRRTDVAVTIEQGQVVVREWRGGAWVDVTEEWAGR